MSRGTTATPVGFSSRCLGHLRGSGISKQGVLKRAGRLQTSRRYKDTEHAARRTVLSRSIRLQICSKRTSGREFQSRLCVSVGSAIVVFSACEPARKWIRAGERRRWCVWPSSEQGDMVCVSYQGRWCGRARSERRECCVADDGEERRKKKRGGRRVEDGEESALNLNSTSTTTRIYRPSECK